MLYYGHDFITIEQKCEHNSYSPLKQFKVGFFRFFIFWKMKLLNRSNFSFWSIWWCLVWDFFQFWNGNFPYFSQEYSVQTKFCWVHFESIKKSNILLVIPLRKIRNYVTSSANYLYCFAWLLCCLVKSQRLQSLTSILQVYKATTLSLLYDIAC